MRDGLHYLENMIATLNLKLFQVGFHEEIY